MSIPNLRSLKHKPVLLIFEKYPKLTEHEIIGQVADWFNVVGRDEFEDAKKACLIIQTKNNPKLWELANQKIRAKAQSN